MVEVNIGYEHGVQGPTTNLASLLHGINEWPRSLVRKLLRPIIAAVREWITTSCIYCMVGVDLVQRYK